MAGVLLFLNPVNLPILQGQLVHSLASKYPSNWYLSAARSLSVLDRFLQDGVGVPLPVLQGQLVHSLGGIL